MGDKHDCDGAGGYLVMYLIEMNNAERVYPTDNGTYIIRDVWSYDGSKIQLETCQYAVNENGAKVWKDCPEGVQFEEIEPFAHSEVTIS